MAHVIDIDPRISQFIEEYMVDFNGSRAARAVGCKEGGADSVQAYRWLTRVHIKEEVARRCALRRAETKINAETVEGYLRDVVEIDLLDIFSETGEVKPLIDIPPHARRAIKSIKRHVKEDPIYGDQVTVTIEMWDKGSHLRMLGQYKKMFTESVEIDLKAKVSFAINGIAK